MLPVCPGCPPQSTPALHQEWASGRLPLLHVRNVSLAMIDQGKLGTGERQLGGARSTSVLCLH